VAGQGYFDRPGRSPVRHQQVERRSGLGAQGGRPGGRRDPDRGSAGGHDVAIIGPAGAEYGIRGWIDATDLNTGEQVWRTYTVAGPDDPVGGPTWVEPGTYETGGGSIWVTGTYDPALNLTYWGTGNPGPDWDAEYRPGDNLYTDSVLALNADNGSIEWFFQYTPNDPYDYDEIGEHPIVDVEIDGEMRRVVTHSGRNGYYYGFDAANGTFLYGKQYTRDMSWTPGLDPKTGKPLAYDPNKTVQAYVTGATPQRGNQGGTVCPIHTGGKNWEPSAYDPVRKTAYILGGEGCNQRITAVQEKPEWQGGTWKHRDRFVGGGGPQEPFPPANPAWPVEERGAITAVDAATGEVKKKVMLDYFNRSGVMASAGGFVMFGDFEGWVQARNSDTLDLVWRFNVGSAIKGPPMSFESNGVQYIAILVGSATGSTQNRVNPALAFYAPAYSLYVFRLDSDLLAPI
jgi:alcohol dehydrogenase (cytochrome c)